MAPAAIRALSKRFGQRSGPLAELQAVSLKLSFQIHELQSVLPSSALLFSFDRLLVHLFTHVADRDLRGVDKRIGDRGRRQSRVCAGLEHGNLLCCHAALNTGG